MGDNHGTKGKKTAGQEEKADTNARIPGGRRDHHPTRQGKRQAERKHQQEKESPEEKTTATGPKTQTNEALMAIQQIRNWVSPIIAALLSFIVAMLLFNFDSLRTQNSSINSSMVPLVRFNEYKDGTAKETEKIYERIDNLQRTINNQISVDREYVKRELNDIKDDLRQIQDTQTLQGMK